MMGKAFQRVIRVLAARKEKQREQERQAFIHQQKADEKAKEMSTHRSQPATRDQQRRSNQLKDQHTAREAGWEKGKPEGSWQEHVNRPAPSPEKSWVAREKQREQARANVQEQQRQPQEKGRDNDR